MVIQKAVQVCCTTKPKSSKFYVPCKLLADIAIHITFQVICMPQANNKRIADEHKTWKVICIAKSPGTTDENLKFPSPLYVIVFLLGKYFVCDNKNRFLILYKFFDIFQRVCRTRFDCNK